MRSYIVVADYREEPAEGIQVVSKCLVDGLRAHGNLVTVVPPGRVYLAVAMSALRRRKILVFTHGPGTGVVLISAILRIISRVPIIWVATRPDVGEAPKWTRNRKTAHFVVANQHRVDLEQVATDAQFINQFIGIDPSRLRAERDTTSPWPGVPNDGRPIALHVGHLRKNRGLDTLIRAKQELGDAVEIVLQASPTFLPDAELMAQLTAAGVHVFRGYVSNLASLYMAADVYLFPVRPEDAGSIELPLTVIEAVACKVPVVTTDFGAIPNALKDVQGVHVVPSSELLAKLAELVRNPELRVTRPHGLPPHLHADRVTDAVLKIAAEFSCVGS